MKWDKEAGRAAFEYHDSGFHCAEAVSKAIVEIYGQGVIGGIPGVATAFGGGIGRTHQDICGALIGGVIAIGSLFGRNEAGADWTDAAELAAELRLRFMRKYSTTNCAILLTIFGPQENGIRCKQLSGEVASMLAEILEERGRCSPSA